jgi:hypothetical protein
MKIDHGVRNSIYRTGRAAALRARLTPLSLIFRAAHGNIRSTWVHHIKAGKHDVFTHLITLWMD